MVSTQNQLDAVQAAQRIKRRKNDGESTRDRTAIDRRHAWLQFMDMGFD